MVINISKSYHLYQRRKCLGAARAGRWRLLLRPTASIRNVEVDSDDTAHYYLSEGLGSTMALTDDSGSVENTYEYDPFGALASSTGSQDNAFTFTGEQTDPSTGLGQFVHRPVGLAREDRAMVVPRRRGSDRCTVNNRGMRA